MGETDIEWTQGDDGTPGKTWNPFRGCRKISPGCKHCYAETFAERFRGVPGHPYEQGFDPRVAPDALAKPLVWKKACRIFVNSMSDLFLEDFTNEEIAAVFGVMAACQHHTFQVLTKRAERMAGWFEWIAQQGRELPALVGEKPPAGTALEVAACTMMVGGLDKLSEDVLGRDRYQRGLHAKRWPLPNVWLGVSAESQKYLLERVPFLRRTPAAVRFLSIEPMLEGMDLIGDTATGNYGPIWNRRPDRNVPTVDIDWVIVGGESGAGSRRFVIQWARNIIRQCKTLDVPCFVKQLGRLAVDEDEPPTGRVHLRLAHKKGGDPVEWPEDLRVRQFPEAT